MPGGRDLAARRARLTPAQRALLEKRLHGTAAGPVAEEEWSITARPQAEAAPASFGQRRLFHFALSRPESLAYHVYYAVGLRGPLDPAALARGLRAVVERHEALRTRFETRDGEVLAVAAPELTPPSLPLIDLAGLPAAVSRETEGLRVVTELATTGFDLRNGPPLRAALLRAGPAEHSLLLAVHHAVIDGWTLALITRDLAHAYEACAAGRRPSWPARPLQSADFAHWQRRRVREGALAEDLAWWRRQMAGAPPEGISWPSRPQSPGGRAALHLGPDLTRSLEALAQRERVTSFITLLAGLDVLLHHGTGQTDLIVGTLLALRGRPEAAGIAGFLLNLLPLRTDLSGDPTFLDVLRRARDTFLGALAHREPPVEWLAEEILPARPSRSLPWIRAVFNMPSSNAGHADPLRVGPLEVQPLITGEMGAEPDLTFYARELGGDIRLDLGVNADLLAPGEPARLLAGFAALLGEIALRPQRRLSELAGVLTVPAGAEA